MPILSPNRVLSPSLNSGQRQPARLPGEKHWHGATPRTAMTHLAIQEQLGGRTVEWMEKVSDEQYRA